MTSTTTTETTTARTWTCKGSVRGECGHTHHSLSAALRCCAADMDAIRRAYPASGLTAPYSDRRPVQLSGPPVSEDEYFEAKDEAFASVMDS